MSALVPCSACHRHVRDHETRCCFCGAERAPLNLQRVPLPRGVKRATLIALGLTLAGQACGGESENIAIYGSTPAPGMGASGGAGGAGGTANGIGGDAGRAAGGSDGGGTVQPVYGASVVPLPQGGNGGMSGSAPIDGEDAGPLDGGTSDAGDPDAN
jgi:hypothetical protein